jgi:hypothetical protein
LGAASYFLEHAALKNPEVAKLHRKEYFFAFISLD